MDEQEAIAELSYLSDNAKRWLENRIGSGLGQIIGYSSMGLPARVEEVSDKLLIDFRQIGIFEMQNMRRVIARGKEF